MFQLPFSHIVLNITHLRLSIFRASHIKRNSAVHSAIWSTDQPQSFSDMTKVKVLCQPDETANIWSNSNFTIQLNTSASSTTIQILLTSVQASILGGWWSRAGNASPTGNLGEYRNYGSQSRPPNSWAPSKGADALTAVSRETLSSVIASDGTSY